MYIYDLKLNISHADLIDYNILTSIEKIKRINFEEMVEKNFEFDIDIENKSVIFNDISNSFENKIIWFSFDPKTEEISINVKDKQKLQIFSDFTISRLVAFIFYDKTTDNLYCFTQDRFLEKYFVNSKFNFKNLTANDEKLNPFSISIDRWDLQSEILLYSLSYLLGIKVSSDYDVYHDIPIGTEVFPIYDDTYLYILKNANIFIKNSNLSELKFKLIKFGHDFTDKIKEYYQFQDENGNILNPTIDNNELIFDVSSKPKKIFFIPTELQRVFNGRAYFVLNNIIEINLFYEIENNSTT